MDKSILSLVILGVVLAVVHVPSVVITVGIITLLVMVTTKLLWAVLQAYSPTTQKSSFATQRVEQN